MKKFAFLLALVALFAMSATAWAAKGDVTLSTVSAVQTDQNNGAVAGGKTDLFYYGNSIPTAFSLGFNASVEGASTDPDTGVKGLSLLAKWSQATDWLPHKEVVDSLAAVENPNRSITYYDTADLDRDDTIEIAVFEAGFVVGTSARLTIAPKEVTFSASSGMIVLEPTDTEATVTIAGDAGEGNTVDFELKAGNDGVKVDYPNNANIKIEIVDKHKIKITPADGGLKDGVSILTVQLSEASVNEGSLKGIKVAGLDGRAQNILDGYMTVMVIADPKNKADIQPGGAKEIEIVSGDAKADLVISTDIVNDIPEGQIFALMVGEDAAPMEQIATSAVVTTRGTGTKFYDVTIKSTDLNTLAPGTYSAYVMGNPNDSGSPVFTNGVKIIVKSSDDPTPTPTPGKAEETPAAISADLPSGVQGVAIDKGFNTVAAVVSGSGIAQGALEVSDGVVVLTDSYLTSAAIADKLNASKWGGADAKSADNVTSFQVVSVDVASAGAVAAIAYPVSGDKLVVSNDVNVADLNIYKVLSGDKVIRLDFGDKKTGETSADVANKYRVYEGATENAAQTIKKGGSYTLVVFVQDDGELDLAPAPRQIIDPVVALKSNEVGGGSSSGACDAGFGLAAVAALAAVALRKRGK